MTALLGCDLAISRRPGGLVEVLEPIAQAAVWLPMTADSTNAVLVVFRDHPHHHLGLESSGTGLLEVGLSVAEVDLRHPVTSVLCPPSPTLEEPPCCRIPVAVECVRTSGGNSLAFAHRRRSVRLGLPPLSHAYAGRDLAAKDPVLVAGYELDPLSPMGVLALGATGNLVLWGDGLGRPRGWEVFGADTFRVPRFAVADHDLLAVPPDSVRTFPQFPVVSEVARAAAKHALHPSALRI